MPERSLYGWSTSPESRLQMPDIKNVSWVPDPATRVKIVQSVVDKPGYYAVLSHPGNDACRIGVELQDDSQLHYEIPNFTVSEVALKALNMNQTVIDRCAGKLLSQCPVMIDYLDKLIQRNEYASYELHHYSIPSLENEDDIVARTKFMKEANQDVVDAWLEGCHSQAEANPPDPNHIQIDESILSETVVPLGANDVIDQLRIAKGERPRMAQLFNTTLDGGVRYDGVTIEIGELPKYLILTPPVGHAEPAQFYEKYLAEFYAKPQVGQDIMYYRFRFTIARVRDTELHGVIVHAERTTARGFHQNLGLKLQDTEYRWDPQQRVWIDGNHWGKDILGTIWELSKEFSGYAVGIAYTAVINYFFQIGWYTSLYNMIPIREIRSSGNQPHFIESPLWAGQGGYQQRGPVTDTVHWWSAQMQWPTGHGFAQYFNPLSYFGGQTHAHTRDALTYWHDPVQGRGDRMVHVTDKKFYFIKAFGLGGGVWIGDFIVTSLFGQYGQKQLGDFDLSIQSAPLFMPGTDGTVVALDTSSMKWKDLGYLDKTLASKLQWQKNTSTQNLLSGAWQISRQTVEDASQTAKTITTNLVDSAVYVVEGGARVLGAATGAVRKTGEDLGGAIGGLLTKGVAEPVMNIAKAGAAATAVVIVVYFMVKFA